MTSIKTDLTPAGRRVTGRHHRPTRWRRAAEIAAPTLVLLLALCSWVIWQGVVARQNLTAAANSLGAAQRAVGSDSTVSLQPYAVAVARDTSAAHRATDDLAWRAASQIPLLGRSLRTVAGVAAAADDFSRRVLPDAQAAYTELRALRAGTLRDGIPLPPLQRAAPFLARAADVAAADRAAVAALPATWLLPSVGSARSRL